MYINCLGNKSSKSKVTGQRDTSDVYDDSSLSGVIKRGIGTNKGRSNEILPVLEYNFFIKVHSIRMNKCTY